MPFRQSRCQVAGAAVIHLLEELNHDAKTTLVLVTHDWELANRARRIIRLADGSIVSDTPTGVS